MKMRCSYKKNKVLNCLLVIELFCLGQLSPIVSWTTNNLITHISMKSAAHMSFVLYIVILIYSHCVILQNFVYYLGLYDNRSQMNRYDPNH